MKNDCHRNTGSPVARNVLVSSYMNGYKRHFCNKEVLMETLCNNFIINGDFTVNCTLGNSKQAIIKVYKHHFLYNGCPINV